MSRNDLPEIKRRIFEEDLIEKILEELGCEHIKRVGGGRWEAQLPLKFGSSNKRSVQVYENEYLSAKIRSRSVNGDIFSIIGYVLYQVVTFDELKDVLHQVKYWVCNTLGWHSYLEFRDDFEEEKRDYLAFLRPIQKSRKQRTRAKNFLDKQNEVLSKEKVLNWYINLPHKNFLDDGISIKTQREFEVMFDQVSERVVFPIYNKDGELISVKGRYVGKDDYLLDEMKYLYLFHFDKMIELFNLHRALPYIKECGEVVVFESEKSCMKAHQYGYKNTVAIMGSDLSPYQAHLLRQLDANIVFAYDNDVELDFIKSQAKQIKTRKCFYIKDDLGLLGDKDSPTDKGEEVWRKLHEKCLKVL